MLTSRNGVAAALAATLIVISAPSGAQTASDAALARWATEAQRDLERKLTDPRPIGKPSSPDGVVDISFSFDALGRPTRVAVFHSSGSRFIDGKAADAVSRIRTRMIARTPDGRTYLARIFFVSADRWLDEEQRREMINRTAFKNRWAVARLPDGENPRLVLAARR